MKISQYIIEKEIFDKTDKLTKFLVFSTRQGLLKVIGGKTWELAKKGEFNILPGDIYNELLNNKIVVDENENEFLLMLGENKAFNSNLKTLYFVIQPTADCPLNCYYCGQSHSNISINREWQQAILERISAKIVKRPSGFYKKLHIGWFGAEPLSGITAIDYLSPKLQSLAEKTGLKYYASVTTNGFLLDSRMVDKLINKHNVKEIEITLDGIAKFHDCRRYTKAGKNSFDTIYKNLVYLLNCSSFSKDMRISIRCNVDSSNKGGVIPLLKQLKSDNLHKKITIYTAPIHSWGNDVDSFAMDKREYADLEIEWLIKTHELGFLSSKNFLPKRKMQPCMVVDNNSELYDPLGNIFHCTEVSLVPTYEIKGGNIYLEGHVCDSKVKKGDIHLRDFYENDKICQYRCNGCKLFPVCAGSCPKEWVEGRVPCPPLKFNIEKRMILQYIFHKNPALLNSALV